tara:strand:- start:460 stop:876 length:417 start_codon:yes stop_codon:yes gene_type:complete
MLIKNLNRKIYKKRYDQGKSCIQGVAVRERTPELSTDHFHMIIENSNSLPGYERFDALLKHQIQLLGGNSRYGTPKKNYIADYKLQNYYNSGDNKLEAYLTKNFNALGRPLDLIIDDIGIMGDSVMFGEPMLRVASRW